MPNYGPPHRLIVHEVGEPYGPLSTNEFEDYELQHPDDCEHYWDEDWRVNRYKCGVGHEESEGSLRFSLQYTGTPIDEPGEYWITAWAEKYVGFEYTDYDGGVAVLDKDEWPLAAGRSEAAEAMSSSELDGAPTEPPAPEAEARHR